METRLVAGEDDLLGDEEAPPVALSVRNNDAHEDGLRAGF